MKKFLSLVLALVMTMSLVTIGAGAAEYKDLTDKSEIQYEEAVAVLNKLGIITGYEDGSFKPTGALTRGAAAKIIVSLMIGSEAASNLTVAAAPYSDVPVTNTFAGVISYCKTAGYINGYADGTFRPTAPLTGYAFTKMLLGALGYDGKIEGFTGTGWTMNVARLGNAAGLFDDFVTAFKGNNGINREEACLLALNTLKATEVEYTGGASVTAGDASVVINAERSYKTSRNDNINANISGQTSGNNSNYLTLEFGEEHFPDLKLDNARPNNSNRIIPDDFGRPSNQWSYKNVKIGTYATKPDFTYTAAPNGDTNVDEVKDMGLKDFVIGNNTALTINGNPTNTVGSYTLTVGKTTDSENAGVFDGITGNGVLVEVYLDDTTADTIASIVVIKTQVMQVNAVRSSEVTFKTANTDMNGTVRDTISAVKDSDDIWNDVKGLKADDIVLVVPLTTDGGATYTANSVIVPQSVTGSLTSVKVKSKNDTVNGVTVAGTAYKMSKLWNSEDNELTPSTKLSSAVDTTIYLDTYGYVIYAKDVQANNSAIIVDEIYSSLVNGKIIKYAKGWDSNGNSIELNLGTSPNLYGHSEADVQGMVFEYATSTANNSEYSLLEPATTWTSGRLVYDPATDTALANGQYTADVVDGATNVTNGKLPFDSAVKVIFISSERGIGSDVTGITVKKGVSEVTNRCNLIYILNKDCNKIVAVVVPNDDDAGNTANLLFFQKVTSHSNNKDGKRVAYFTAWIDGVETKDCELNQDISDDSYNNTFFTYSKDESTGVYTLTKYQKFDAANKATTVSQGAVKADGTYDAVVTLNGVDLTDAQNFYFRDGNNVYLNAKNAQVIDLYGDDGHYYSTVKEMKDAVKNGDIDTSTGRTITGFKVAYVYNNDNGDNGYRTVSKLFITESIS
ncbi:S-layer homology domain-containing protein [uncultured Oscillibacter sp.]|uniref:S-layer homology domain-containing protein n=1 Tax=uncultured Oscillibacter sp. TaxID=876091 RepID=UPI0025D908EA|nr:S-layer homology domain-containing protein [uncultured Oscillibacter sp.]